MKYCPRCFRTDADLGDCANFAIGCPDPVKADPKKVVHVACGPCGKTLAIPVGNIMRGRTSGLPGCKSDKCAAQLLLPADKPKAAPGPKPIGAD